MGEVTPGMTSFATVFLGGLGPLPATLLAAALVVLVAVAARRNWPLAIRRALFFSLLLALLAIVAALLSPDSLAAARNGLVVAVLLLAGVALVECVQGLIVDLVLVGWLKRPPPPRILRDFVTIAIALSVFLASLRGLLGFNLSSLLATSAMISVVLGLALQDTLGSFFAGMALQMEAPLAIGDNVQIGEAQGTVVQVSWRTVRILNLDRDEVTFPNSLVTRSTLINFSRPTPAHLCHVEVLVPYRHPPSRVLAVLTEAMRDLPGVLPDPPCHALVWSFTESALVYRARYFIADFRRINFIRSDVGARLWYALRRAEIEQAYPVRVHLPENRAEDPGDRVAEALLKVDILGPLSAAERAGLAEQLRPLRFACGETVIRQGDEGDSLFVILQGRVEVCVGSAGQQEVVNTLAAGSVFGEMSLLTGAPRSATVRAVEDVEVVPVTVKAFRGIVTKNPAVLDAVTGVVSRRLSRLDEAIHVVESEAAARSAEHVDLLQRVRAFFGV
jgi:small-conductance mechanosensitive channel/CRP-like cAMP-binding protein